jgi:peptide/nickel transport system ATP-binding protein/oligopeptide transport system ATP-binding protein
VIVSNTVPLLEVQKLKKYFPTHSHQIVCKAVDDVSFTLKNGETLGLVGESGCGKSTLGRCILRLLEPTDGKVFFEGIDLSTLKNSEMRRMRKKMQIVFQNPYSSLNPRMTILDTIKDALDNNNIGNQKERIDRTREIMKFVGMDDRYLYRYPHEFSGGQRQRIVIARALVLSPSFIICDEPVSALDVSVRAQVLNLMKDIQDELGVAYLFVSHDLSVVRYISHRIAVMYLGKIVEIADKAGLYENPLHPYAKALISAIPIPDRSVKHNRSILRGDLPSPLNPPSGCRFHTRCPQAFDCCKIEEPVLKIISETHSVACHLVNRGE